MKPEDFADLLGELDDRFLTEPEPRAKRPLRWRPLLVAAALCLLGCGSTVAYAASEEGGWIIDIFARREVVPGTGDYASGYDLDYYIGRVDPSELSDEITGLRDKIVRRIAEYQPHMSHVPNIVGNSHFETPAEALDYIGYAPLRAPDLGTQIERIYVGAHGGMQGDIRMVSYEIDYRAEGLVIQTFARLYTTHYDGDQTGTGAVTHEWRDFTSTQMTTPGGLPYLKVESEPASGDPDRYRDIGAYLIRDDVIYNIRIAYKLENEQVARAYVDLWLEGLDN